jgi:hypothetical protein
MSSPAAYAKLADLHRELAAVYADLAAQEPAPQPDRVVGIDEAAQRLGMERSWLERRANWKRVGGFKDADRHVKFSMAALEAYIQARGKA